MSSKLKIRMRAREGIVFASLLAITTCARPGIVAPDNPEFLDTRFPLPTVVQFDSGTTLAQREERLALLADAVPYKIQIIRDTTLTSSMPNELPRLEKYMFSQNPPPHSLMIVFPNRTIYKDTIDDKGNNGVNAYGGTFGNRVIALSPCSEENCSYILSHELDHIEELHRHGCSSQADYDAPVRCRAASPATLEARARYRENPYSLANRSGTLHPRSEPPDSAAQEALDRGNQLAAARRFNEAYHAFADGLSIAKEPTRRAELILSLSYLERQGFPQTSDIGRYFTPLNSRTMNFTSGAQH